MAIELVTPNLCLLENINNNELAQFLYQKRLGPDKNTLLALLKRVISTLEDPALEDLQIIQRERQRRPGFVEEYVKAFIDGMIAYLGKNVTLDHLLSRDMPESAIFQGATLNNFDLVALAAIFKGDDDILRALLGSRRIGNKKDFYSIALYLASFVGDVDMYALLMRAGNIDRNDLYNIRGDAIFTCAAKNGHIELIDLLLQEGVQVTRCNSFPLHEAASNGQYEAVRKLLDVGFDPNAMNHADETPLHAAVRCSKPEQSKQSSAFIVKALLESGANPKQHIPGQTALQLAARYGNSGVVKLLLQAGADPNLVPQGTESPLLQAIGSGDTETVKTLIMHGASIHQSSKKHGNALIAAIKGGQETIFDLLLDDFDANSTDGTGASALYFAASGGHEGMVIKLINHGANVLAKRNTILSPAMGAGSGGNGQIVKILFRKGIHEDTAALYAASSAGENEIVTHLLSKGADVEHSILPSARDLALHAAMTRGHESTVQLLLGAKATCTNRHFPSIFLETASRKHLGTAALVLSAHTTGPIRLTLNETSASKRGDIPIALLLLTLKVGIKVGKSTAAWEFIRPYGEDVVKFMEYLLTQDAKLKLPVDSPKSALKAAVESHNPSLTAFLLDCYGANISTDHPNLVELAVVNDDLSTLEQLMQRIMKEKEPKPPRWQLCLNRAFMAALERNTYPMVEMLARYGAFSDYSSSYTKRGEGDENTRSSGQSNESTLALTAVETAMKKGNELIVRFLIALGVLDHAESDGVSSILSKAERYRCSFLSELLSDRGIIGFRD